MKIKPALSTLVIEVQCSRHDIFALKMKSIKLDFSLGLNKTERKEINNYIK